jgi:hypothetical protein
MSRIPEPTLTPDGPAYEGRLLDRADEEVVDQGVAFDIRTHDGAVAHSACVGFGLERVALALFKKHGLQLEKWPAEVRDVLALS